MAPAGSDERTTELAEPINSDNDDSSASDATPFGDWREQLRERVKEIRARKHAAHREDIDDLSFEAAATAATAEKLEAARAQATEGAMDDEPQVQLVDRARDDRRADIADIVDDLVGPPAAQEMDDEPIAAAEVQEPESMEPGVAALPEAEEPEAIEESLDPEPSFFEPAANVEPVEAAREEEPPAAEPTVPLFQDEPDVFADDPLLELEGELDAIDEEDPLAEPALTLRDEDPAAIEAEPEVAFSPIEDEPEIEAEPLEPAGLAAELFEAEETPEPQETDGVPELFGAENEAGDADEADAEAEESVPSWARSAASEFAPPPTAVETGAAGNETSRLDSIPPELRDVEIPAWALPREPSRESEPAAASSSSLEADEIAAPESDSTEPLEADLLNPAPTEPVESVTEDVHLVGEFTTPTTEKRTDLPPAETPVPPAEMLNKSIGDLSALAESEEVEIAPPGGLVDAADLGIDLHAEDDDRALPGLFDGTGEVEAADDVNEPADDSTDALAEAALAHIRNANADSARELDEIELRADDKVEADLDAISSAVAASVDAARSDIPEPIAEEPVEAATPEPVTAAAPATEPAGEKLDLLEDEAADGGNLEWDVDDDLDAELVEDARRQHADASAPLSDRVYSALADGLVVLTMGIVLMIAGASAAGTPVVPFVQAAPLPFLLAWGLFGLVYGVIFVGTSGQTLGKMAMRVRVIGADTFHVGYGRAALRALAYAAAALPVGLGLLSAVRDPEHRGLHDRLSSTRVVKA